MEFVNSFDDSEELKATLQIFKNDILGKYPDEKLQPISFELSPFIGKKLEEIAKTMGMTEEEALKWLMKDKMTRMKESEVRFKKLAERLKGKGQKSKKPA